MKEMVYKQDAIDALWKAEKELPYYDSAQVAVNVIKDLPSAQPDHVVDIGKKVSISCKCENDLISRQVAIDAIRASTSKYTGFMEMEMYMDDDAVEAIKGVPPAQHEITDEQAIEHLQSTGWMQNHDREMYESGLREQLADDSGSYDSLIPCEDAISRQAVLDGIEELKRSPWYQSEGYAVRKDAVEIVEQLCVKNIPSAQPEQRWIPTSERPPKVREWVLCQCRAGIMDVLRLTEDGEWNKVYPPTDYMRGFVIAWMPLPEPYQEGEQNE